MHHYVSGLARAARASWVAPELLALTFLIAGSAAHAATYALQITSPQAGLTTANRYYMAYPGLIYDVPVAAIGGKYPYTYALAAAPSGMSINANTGEISWPSPVASGTPYNVTAQVTDSAGSLTKVSWTVTVTTKGFVFVDAVNGKSAAQGGDGSAGNPFRSISDWYISKYDTTYNNYFVYFKDGTYTTDSAPVEDGTRLALVGAKSVVWLAYPGTKPVIDTTGSYIAIYGGVSNTYFDGLAIQNFTTNFGVRIDSSGDNVVFRNNNFSNLPASAGGVGTNAAALMIADGGSVGNRWSILNNNFSNIIGTGYAMLGYGTKFTLVDGNTVTHFGNIQNIAIGPKDSNAMWFIRNNRINISQGIGIWINTYAVLQSNADFEISYNLVQVASGNTFWLGQQSGAYGAVTDFRNTYVGAPIRIDNLASSNGPVKFSNDVAVSNSGAASMLPSNPLLQLSGNLTGTTSTGIVNSSGNLTGSYTSYLGVDGYQLAVVPNAPTAVTVD